MSTNNSAMPSRFRVWCLGCLLAIAAVFVFATVWSATPGFWQLGVVDFLIFGLPLALVTLLLGSLAFLIAGWFVARSTLSFGKKRMLLIAPWILVACFWIVFALIVGNPRSRFGAIVVRPVPSSVEDIRVAGLNSFLARRWLFSFRIESAQIDDMLARHSLERTNYFDFRETIDHDVFFKQVAWAKDAKFGTNALFYSRSEMGVPSRWVRLVVDTNSSHAWFMIGYQN